MSVCMQLTVHGDRKRLQQVMEANENMWHTINERAKANGCVHHRFQG